MAILNKNASSLAPTAQYSNSIKATSTAFNKIDTSEKSIITINAPSNPATPNLAKHLQNAKDIANNWNTKVKPNIINSLNNVSAYSDLFNSLYKQLSTNAVAIQANAKDVTAMNNFKADIKKMQSSTKTIYDETLAGQTILSTFQSDTSAVIRDFSGDLGKVKVELSADISQMQNYHNQMSQLQKQLNAAEEQKEEMTSWWMTVLTLGLSQVIALIENLQGQVNSLNQRIRNLSDAERRENQEIIILSQLANTLSTLLGLANILQTTTVRFITTWETLSNNLNELETMEGIAPTDAWAESDLEAVNTEWQDIAKEIKLI